MASSDAEVKDKIVTNSKPEDDLKFNIEAAESLANEAQHLPIAEAIPLYEKLLAAFPTAAKYWKQYVEAYLSVNNDDAAKQIFSRCLLNCLDIPLWKCYIRFIKKVNQNKGLEGQEETRKAFDFMLSYVGVDIASGPIWMEYITFIKSLPGLSSQEESQRMTAIRKAYQKAIVTPTHYIEQLWRDYDNFENSVSRQLAKGLVSEYQPKFNSARAVYRERKKYIDQIDWSMLAVPPSGSPKEELQWVAWKKLLAFEKGNPQRIDSSTSIKRIIFTYEQCLMYLYHYPDIWYDYAGWHANNGSIDAAIKVFQRSLKALPDSDVLKYAYAELEESRGSIQLAKKVYESLLGDGVSTTALAHIQFIRFLRRTEGVEAARKYFLDARKLTSCTYHVYVAYAMMAFCCDKDPKIAHNVFEAGLKQFMHEPAYILEYADFLACLNDDRNIRALFERALSTLLPNESSEVWKRFVLFEQTYGDLTSMLKVEKRRKEALLQLDDDGVLSSESSLRDVVSRYSFMGLWPCSSQNLDHLAAQEWLVKNININPGKSILSGGLGISDIGSISMSSDSSASGKVIYPDTSQMLIYDPSQRPGTGTYPMKTSLDIASDPIAFSTTKSTADGSTNTFDELLKMAPPVLVAFLANLPSVEGPIPDVDVVLSICLQSDIPILPSGKSSAAPTQGMAGPDPSTSDISGSNKSRGIPNSSFKPVRDRKSIKRKDLDRQEDDDTATIQSQPLPRDVFRMRQIQKARGSTSQTGSASYGSAFSGDLSGSTG